MQPPENLGKYQIREVLGRGSYAVVYRAIHSSLGTEVAVKVLDPALTGDTHARERFLREAQAASQLQHPAIVHVLDMGEEQGVVYLVMDYMPGGNLRHLLDAEGVLSPQRVAAVLSPVAEALDYAHARGMLHRDVKPTNILLDAEGKAYLSDFGLVRVAHAPRLTRVGAVVGTAAYMAPEQAEGRELDGRADQYALAVVAYEMLAGRPPFQGEDSTAVALMHIEQPPPSPAEHRPDLPDEVAEVVLKALSKQPEERFPTCKAFIDALQEAWLNARRAHYQKWAEEIEKAFREGRFADVVADFQDGVDALQGDAQVQAMLEEANRLRKAAEVYLRGVQAWEKARQRGRQVLAYAADFPDPEGVLETLGLRSPRRWPGWREAARQIGIGLALAFPLLLGVFYLAFRWITRP